MDARLRFTLTRGAKGPMAPPPQLAANLQAVADAVVSWPEIQASTHWHFSDHRRVDGVDFYVGSDELGHLHLDGSIHMATTPQLRAALVAEGLGWPFKYGPGWTETSVAHLGIRGAIAFLRRNYDYLRPALN